MASPLPLGEKAGDRIGRYKLLQEIGAGGFGVVYMAEQEEPVRRRVALKIIKMGMDTKEVIARFGQERQALALMDHPNIAKVLDAGATEGGRPFFVMELVKGERVTDYCDKNNLSTRQRLGLFMQICHAIQHAHQKGIIHRDIKPSNILVAMQDGVPVPKVIDFGIAKATEQRLTDKSFFTALGDFVGTPAYMSPEQAEMTGLDIDTRSDIYSLGVVLYELLTGKTPFDTKELLAKGIEAMRCAIREEEPRRPSTRLTTMDRGELTTTAKRRQTDAPKLVHQVRGDLDWIVMKCLEKDRTRRYETANGLASDILRHVSNEPVLARPPGQAYRFQKMVRRNKLAFAAVAGIVAALAAGLALAGVALVKEHQAVFEAETQRLQAQASEKKELAEAAEVARERDHVKAAADKLRASLAESYFMRANRLIEQDKSREGVAYLAQSLTLNPTNEAALTRLTMLLTYRTWPKLISIGPKWDWRSRDGKFAANVSSNVVQIFDAQTGLPLGKLLLHNGKVHRVEFSPDGRKALTESGWGDTVALGVWDLQSGRRLFDCKANTASFSPDGGKLLVRTRTQAQIWSCDSTTSNMMALVETNTPKYATYTSQFSPDGKLVATADVNAVRLWNSETGDLEYVLNQQGMAHQLSFSPDGRRIFTATQEGTACIWDVQTRQLLTPPFHDKRIGYSYSAHFSPDDQYLITRGFQSTRLWDASNGVAVTKPWITQDVAESVTFTRDMRKVLTASENGFAQVWDVQSDRPLTEAFQLDVAFEASFDAAFSSDGQKVEALPHTWDVRAGLTEGEPLLHRGRVILARFSPEGDRVLTASTDRTIRIWDWRTGRPITEPLPHDADLVSAHFSPDGKKIVTVLRDFSARVWDAQTGKPLTDPFRHQDHVNDAVFSPDSRRIVTCSFDNTARIWDAQTGKPITGPLQHESFVDTAYFSPDGQKILTASLDGTAQVWDAQTGRALGDPLRQPDGFSSAQYSSDGRRIVTASSSGAQVWDALSRKPLGHPILPKVFIDSAWFSPDGQKVVTASADGSMRIWNAETGKPVTDPIGHLGIGLGAFFSPDGNRIITSPTGRIWDARTCEPLTDRFEFQWWSGARFSPDGRKIVICDGDAACVHFVALDPPRAPEWLSQLAEEMAGCKLNESAVVEWIEPNTNSLRVMRDALASGSENDEWTLWGRWLLADPATRTISPWSKTTVPEYLDAQITRGDADSLEIAEAVASRLGDSERIRRVAEARLTPAYKTNEAARLILREQWGEVAALFAQVTKERDRDQIDAWFKSAVKDLNAWQLNSAAWKLATSLDAKSRNGPWAVFCAQRASALPEAPAGTQPDVVHSEVLDTLAAAYAESGQFDKALATERDAIGSEQNDSLKSEYESRLKLFEAKKPYHTSGDH